MIRPKLKDNLARGSAVHTAKLSEADVITIRSAYRQGETTYHSLASRFGVTKMTIGNVVTRKTWKHLTET